MAQNETSVSGDVVWQDGDDLSEANLTRVAAKNNQTDYVERGLTVTVDSAAGTIDVGSGHCTIQDGINAFETFPNQQTGISLPEPSGTNYVYVTIDETSDDSITLHVDDDDSPPSSPSLKIATADGGTGTATQLNRGPVADFETVEIGGTAVLQSDGMVAASAIPDLAITNTFVVADESERLNLDAEEGDLAIQQDVDESYILTTNDPTQDSNWSEIVTSPAQHAASHEKGGSDELTTFGDTTHDSVSTNEANITQLAGLNIESASDVSGSRTPNTDIQNTTDYTQVVTVYYIDSNLGSDGENHRYQIRVGASSSLSDPDDTIDGDSARGDTGDRVDLIASVVVPPGYWYRVNTGGDADFSAASVRWTERRLIP